MKRSLIPVIAFLALSQNVTAASVNPKFNLTGTWEAATGGSASFFQEGTQVTFININSGYYHYYVGRYVTPTKIAGIQHRITRSTGCSTEMSLTITATTSNSISIAATGLDSNCDVIKGGKYTDSASKTQ